MRNLYDAVFDEWRDWIDSLRGDKSSMSWDEIDEYFDDNLDELDEVANDIGRPISLKDWHELVSIQKQEEDIQRLSQIANGTGIIMKKSEDSSFTVPGHRGSNWQSYRELLQKKKKLPLPTIDSIEKAAFCTLKRLSLNTYNPRTGKTDARKGLIIGNVQSGKTANMAALMAMAADWGWNFFIVLTGSIESLRGQTEERLMSDLNGAQNARRRFCWHNLRNPDKRSAECLRLQDCQLNDGAPVRYMTVCLKNKDRLNSLLDWLNTDQHQRKNLRILVLDDEADQAGINTANIDENERSKINEQIISIVEGIDGNGKPSEPVQSMSYIAYTATPYANFLNENMPESLFPKDFIQTLTVSDQYFGPQQIFGIPDLADEDESGTSGMNIIRVVLQKDVEIMKKIQAGKSSPLPETLQDALCWFIAASACLRSRNYKAPTSMLIHTTYKTDEHKKIEKAVADWFDTRSGQQILDQCRQVWKRETESLTKADFYEQYPNYGEAENEQNIPDYPPFEELVPYIHQLLEKKITAIRLDDEKESEFVYTSGIHLCVDNSRNSKVENDQIKRLIYPKADQIPCDAPAFIVIGGTTISRGLTLEGLTSSYFLRMTGQADSLMQMCRWFGYRKGYELLPRIWMTDNTRQQIQFLSEMDYDLRQSIQLMDHNGETPDQYPPRILNTPKALQLKITSENKQQSSEIVNVNYYGHSSQTTLFENDSVWLKENLLAGESLIDSLGAPCADNELNCGPWIWKNVDLHILESFFRNYKICSRMHLSETVLPLLEHTRKLILKGKLKNWTVALAGSQDLNAVPSLSQAHKITRTRIIQSDEDSSVIDIRALRSGLDLLIDVPRAEKVSLKLSEEERVSKTLNTAAVREQTSVSSTPLLILYRINKDSKVRKGNRYRMDLNAPEDLLGINIYIPDSGTDDVFRERITLRKLSSERAVFDTDMED